MSEKLEVRHLQEHTATRVVLAGSNCNIRSGAPRLPSKRQHNYVPTRKITNALHGGGLDDSSGRNCGFRQLLRRWIFRPVLKILVRVPAGIYEYLVSCTSWYGYVMGTLLRNSGWCSEIFRLYRLRPDPVFSPVSRTP
jgi:hypothetical protein